MRSIPFFMALFAVGPAHAEPATYVIDPAHTQVSFSVNRFGFNHVLGQFDGAVGEIILDEADPARSSVSATIPTGAVTLGDAARDEHVRGAHWLNTAAFPTIVFRSTSVRLTSERDAEVAGDLTLLGQTHPITLHVRLNRIGPLPNNQLRGAGFSATATLPRSVWGLQTAAALIGENVEIAIEALGYVPEQQPGE